MSVSLVLLLAMVVMYAVGFTLMLDRGLTRILLGFLLVGNATNLLIFLMSGNFGAPPIYGTAAPEDMSDPLPQAFILTAIVITFAVTAFLLALIYRSHRIDSQVSDKVRDDAADLELSQDDSVTAEEVTEDDLEESSDFDDPDEAEEIERERIEAEILTQKARIKAKRRKLSAKKHTDQNRHRGAGVSVAEGELETVGSDTAEIGILDSDLQQRSGDDCSADSRSGDVESRSDVERNDQ